MALSAGQVSIAVKPDTAGFGSSLKSGIMGHVGGVGGDIGGAILGGLKAFAGPIAAVGAAFSVKHLIEDSAKAFEDLAGSVKGMQRVVGGSVEGISGLRGAMQLAGVPVDNLNSTMTRFAKNLATADEKGSPVNKMFASMGVSATDAHGKLLPVDQLLPGLADKFKAMPNGAEKTAAAMALFGRQGAAMIPFLNKGSEGIAELTQKAKDMGLTLDDTSMKIFGESRESARNFAASIQGVKVAIGQDLVPVLDAFQNIGRNALAPVLQNIAKFMNDNRESFMKFAEMVSGAGKSAMEGLSNLLKPAGDSLKQLGPVFAQLAPQIMQLMSAFSPVGLLFKSLQPVLPDIIKLVTDLAVSLGGTLAGVLKEILPPITDVVKILVSTFSGILIQLMPAITDLAKTLGTQLGEIIKQLAPVVVMLVQAIASLLPPLLPLIPTIVNLAIQAIVPLVKAILPLVSALLPPLIDLFKFLLPPVTAIAQFLVQVLVVAVNVVVNVLKVIIQVITNVITWLTNFIKSITDTAKKIGDFFGGLGRSIQDMLANAGQWLMDAGKNIIEGLINGAKSMGDAVQRWISNLGNSIINGFKSMFGIHSPSTVFHEFGVNIGQGLANGIDYMVDPVTGSLKRLGTAVTEHMTNIVTDVTGKALDITGMVNDYNGVVNMGLDKGMSFSDSLKMANNYTGGSLQGRLDSALGQTTLTNRATGMSVTIGSGLDPAALASMVKAYEDAGYSKTSGTTIIYNAAPNDTITAEQKLVDAVQRAKVLGAI